jgi:hypothetical protein
LKKNKLDNASSNDVQIPAIVVAEKLGFNFFLSKNLFFSRKYLENTLRVVINLFLALKNKKHHPKNQNQHEIKNQTKLRFVVTSTFNVKKKNT